jgi:hypothetical protein
MLAPVPDNPTRFNVKRHLTDAQTGLVQETGRKLDKTVYV